MSRSGEITAQKAEAHAARALEQRNAAFRVLYDTVLEVTADSSGQHTLDILCRNLRKIAKADVAALATFDADRRTLTLAALDGGDDSCADGELGKSVALPPDDLSEFMTARVKECVAQKPCLAELFGNCFHACGHANGRCYTLSYMCQGELIAAGAIRLPPGGDLRMRDLVETYLNMAGTVIHREATQRELQEAHRLLEERVKARTKELREVNRHLERQIEDRRRVEEALRHSEEQFRALFECSPDAIFVEDFDGTILDVNAAACGLHGVGRGGLIGKNVIDLVPEEVREKVTREFPKWQSGELKSYEGLSLRNDGRSVPVEIRTSRVTYAGEQALLLHVCDITARKEAEEALRRSEEQLRQSQKMEALGRLAGGVAHDFNNMLTSILGFSQLVLQQLRPDDQMRPDIEQVILSGERAAELTKRLLAFGRKQIVQMRPVNLNAIVADMEKLLRRTLGEDVEVVTVLGEGLGSVQADPGQIGQVIMNIAVNARDAMPRGGKLTIRTARVRRAAPARGEGAKVEEREWVSLSIADTGSGMNREIRDRIFDPFFTTKDKGQGSGLGLSMVYGIVDQSGGFVEVDSSPGQGSEFRVSFPRLEAPAEDIVREPETPLLRGEESILVVEDEDAVRHLTVRILESLGYEVLQAANAGEALLLCERRKPPLELVLTDVVMPQMNGREMVERLREIRDDFAVLYMTGFTQDTMLQHGVAGVAPAVLTKPFTRESLAMKVREVLDPKRTPDAQ